MIDTILRSSASPWTRTSGGHAYTWGEGVVVPASPVHESVSWSELNEEFVAAARKVARLLRMLPDWDSYGAKAIDRQRAETALDLLWVAVASGVPTPAIVPTSDGGIQLEWHRCGVDLEIHVTSGTSMEVFFEDLATGEIHEGEVEVDLAPLISFLDRVSC